MDYFRFHSQDACSSAVALNPCYRHRACHLHTVLCLWLAKQKTQLISNINNTTFLQLRYIRCSCLFASERKNIPSFTHLCQKVLKNEFLFHNATSTNKTMHQMITILEGRNYLFLDSVLPFACKE